MLSLEEIKQKDKKYYMNTFGERTPVYFTHGEGVFLFDNNGKKYMDLLGGIAVNVLGHGNKALTEAIASQSKKLIHCSNLYYGESQALLAEELISMSPGMDKVFFTNSGAEANEGAIKLARGYFYKSGSPRPKILSAINSFHGRTLATVTATGQEKYSKAFAPLPPGFFHIPYNDIKGSVSQIDSSTAAVILELIQGESGVVPADPDYVKAVADACRKHGALLIIDEIQTGMGRTGTFFAYEQFDIMPDIVTLAKGLGGGVPIGALMAKKEIAAAFSPGDHGTTFGGNPLACAASLAVLKEYRRLSLCEKAAENGKYFIDKLSALFTPADSAYLAATADASLALTATSADSNTDIKKNETDKKRKVESDKKHEVEADKKREVEADKKCKSETEKCKSETDEKLNNNSREDEKGVKNRDIHVRGKGLMLGIILDGMNAVEVRNRLFHKGYLVNAIGENILRLLPPLIISKEEIDVFCRDFKEIITTGL